MPNDGYAQDHKFYFDDFPKATIVGVLNWTRGQVPMVMDEAKSNGI